MAENKTKKNSLVKKTKNFLDDLWTVSSDGEKGIRRAAIIFARIVYTICMGIVKKRILVQASSLSYATLLAVGPILAITVMFSSVFFKDKDEDFVYNNIMAAATFVMPAFNEMNIDEEPASTTEKTTSQNSTKVATTDNSQLAKGKAHINPEIYKFIDNISKGSGKAGVVGVVAMIITCLLLLINME